MKCPYNKFIEQVVQVRHEHNEDGLNTFDEQTLIETCAFYDCIQDECAAWRYGKCNYKGCD